MRIDVAASRAFHGVPLQALADEQRLNLSEFQRAQHAPKASDAASVAARLAERLLNKIAPAVILPLVHDRLRRGYGFRHE